MAEAAAIEACPACGVTIDIDAGFSAWCEDCGWNLLPSGATRTQTRRQRRRAKAAAHHEDAILVKAMTERGHQVRSDVRSRLAVGIAVAVHLLTLSVLVLGLWLGWVARQIPVVGLSALACCALAWALRPRLGRLPRDFVLSRDSHPLFFDLLDSVSGAADAPRFDYAVLERDPSDATARLGLRRRRVILIGAALWSVLKWDERIAVLAHEAGHNVSNDSRRGYFLGSSLKALAVWIDVLTPKSRVHHHLQLFSRAFIRLPLRWLAGCLYAAQLRLSSGVSRMAEYRADHIAASVAGTEAAIRALDKSLLTSESMMHLAQALLYRPDAPLWAAQKAFIDNYPSRQRARLRKIDPLIAASIYASHPTVSRRIAYLSASPVPGSMHPRAAGRLSEIEAELDPQLHRMAEGIRREAHSKLTPPRWRWPRSADENAGATRNRNVTLGYSLVVTPVAVSSAGGWSAHGHAGSNRPVSRYGRHRRRREAALMGSGTGHSRPRASRVRRAAALAILLALADAGCQTGGHARASGGGVSSSAPARTVSAPARTASVPGPAGGGTYAAICDGAPGCPSGSVPAALRRPIHLPRIAAGTRCPASAPGHKVDPNQAAAIGAGPIYVLSFMAFARTAVLPFVLPSPALFGGSAWGGQVLKWIGAPSYHGPVLIRGRKLTGRDGLGFGAGKVPLAEMDVPPGGPFNPGGWRLWAGYARLRSPGCYGLQVDGTTFSEVIIFRACLSSNPRQQTGRCRSP
jgi:Zn-dependent protease with chaperone function